MRESTFRFDRRLAKDIFPYLEPNSKALNYDTSDIPWYAPQQHPMFEGETGRMRYGEVLTIFPKDREMEYLTNGSEWVKVSDDASSDEMSAVSRKDDILFQALLMKQEHPDEPLYLVHNHPDKPGNITEIPSGDDGDIGKWDRYSAMFGGGIYDQRTRQLRMYELGKDEQLLRYGSKLAIDTREFSVYGETRHEPSGVRWALNEENKENTIYIDPVNDPEWDEKFNKYRRELRSLPITL